MSSLYVSAHYGYSFSPKDFTNYNEWLTSNNSSKFIDEFENNYQSNNMGINLVNNGEIAFIKMFKFSIVLADGDFIHTDKICPDELVINELNLAFQDMLKNPNIPDVFKNEEDWKEVDVFLSVTS